MAAKFRIELNRAGVRSLLQSAEIIAIMTELATDGVQRAKDAGDISAYVGRNRANVSIATTSSKNNNILIKAMLGGG